MTEKDNPQPAPATPEPEIALPFYVMDAKAGSLLAAIEAMTRRVVLKPCPTHDAPTPPPAAPERCGRAFTMHPESAECQEPRPCTIPGHEGQR